jgi:hypothetical protein
MKKNTITVIMLVIIIILLVIVFLPSDGPSTITQFLTGENQDDIVEIANKYHLLYNFNLKNSVPPECSFNEIEYRWTFSVDEDLKIYKTKTTYNQLHEILDDNETFSQEEQAINHFWDNQPDAAAILLADEYDLKVHSDTQNTYELFPYFQNINDTIILSTQLGVWRNPEGEFKAGLYEASNGFNTFEFDKEDIYHSFKPINEQQTKDLVNQSKIKFLNHLYLCEDDTIQSTAILDIEIIYIHFGEYLFPVYKIIGEFKIADETILWTGLVNPIDYTEIDLIAYEDTKKDITFLPKPLIIEIVENEGEYSIQGKIPKTIRQNSNKKVFNEFIIAFDARENAGEYTWTQKDSLQDEINETLAIDDNGTFTFSFSKDIFWNVEQMFYEDENGNTLDEPVHSPDSIIQRNPVDNWFRLQYCATADDTEYCSEFSKTYFLP